MFCGGLLKRRANPPLSVSVYVCVWQMNLLLSHKTFKIADMGTINSPDLCQNVRLLREEGVQRRVGRHGKEGWDQQGYWKGSQVGSHVRCARSATTCKRHVTIAGLQEG